MSERAADKLTTDLIPAWTQSGTLEVGQTIIAPARRPTRWQRLMHWLRGTEPPKTETWVVTHTSTGSGHLS